jgi:hypothetical protein
MGQRVKRWFCKFPFRFCISAAAGEACECCALVIEIAAPDFERPS